MRSEDIIRCLREHGPQTIPELCKRLNAGEKTLRRHISSLRKRGGIFWTPVPRGDTLSTEALIYLPGQEEQVERRMAAIKTIGFEPVSNIPKAEIQKLANQIRDTRSEFTERYLPLKKLQETRRELGIPFIEEILEEMIRKRGSPSSESKK